MSAPLPPDWSPEQDNDAEWRALRELVRDADRPACTPAASLALARQALAAARGEPAAPPRESFGQWLRQVFLGGGLGGQIVRLGVCGAAAFAFGAQWNHRDPASTEVALASPPPRTLAIAGVSAPKTIERSAMDETGHAVSASQAAERMDMWGDNAVPLGVTASAGNWGARQVSNSPPSYGASPGEALSIIQQLRYLAIARRDDGMLREIRSLEAALPPSLHADPALGAGQASALARYREGEAALAAKRWDDAVAAFTCAREDAPGSFVSFLSQLQVGRTQFEQLGNFTAALAAYRGALADYPASFLGDASKAELQEQVRSLTCRSARDLLGLRLWSQAQRQKPPVRTATLLRLLRSAPSSPVAGRAAQLLVDGALSGAAPNRRLCRQADIVIREALLRGATDAARGQLSLALGRIADYALGDRPGAAATYCEALEAGVGDSDRRWIAARLRALDGADSDSE